MSNRGDLPPEDDDEFDFNWLNNPDDTPDGDVDLFGTPTPDNLYPDRDRDAGIGQAQYGKLVTRRMEDAIEQAEQAEFGDTDQLLDWMAEPDTDDNNLPEWLRDMPTPNNVSTAEVEAVRSSMLADAPQTEDMGEAPSWLQGANFETSDAEWVARTGFTDNLNDLNDPSSSAWVARTGDTDTLNDPSGSAWVARTGDTDKLPDGGDAWLGLARFSESADTTTTGATPIAKNDKDTGGLSLAAFGLEGVEPLRTEEVPAIRADQLDQIMDEFDPFTVVSDEELPPTKQLRTLKPLPAATPPNPDLFGFDDFSAFEQSDELIQSDGADEDLFSAVDFGAPSPDQGVEDAWAELASTNFGDYQPPVEDIVPTEIDPSFFDLDFVAEQASDDPFDDDLAALFDAELPQAQSLTEGLFDENDFDLPKEATDEDLFGLLDFGELGTADDAFNFLESATDEDLFGLPDFGEFAATDDDFEALQGINRDLLGFHDEGISNIEDEDLPRVRGVDPTLFNTHENADFEATSTLPRSDFDVDGGDWSPLDDNPVQNNVPQWLRDDAPSAEPSRDWLSDFDAPTSEFDDEAFASLLDDIPDQSVRTTLPEMESTGEAPNWLSRLSTDEMAAVPSQETMFGNRRFSMAGDEVERMLSDSGDTDFNQLLSGIQPAANDNLDSLLAGMRDNQESIEAPSSFGDLFDSDLFDTSGIAELGDEEPVAAANARNLDDLFSSDLFDTSAVAEFDDDPIEARSLDDIFNSELFDTSELSPIDDGETASRADLSDIFGDDEPAQWMPKRSIFDDVPLDGDAINQDAVPAWLRGVQGSATSSALAASLRQQQDRSLDDLDDRLLALRDEGLSIRVDEGVNSGLMTEILPGVSEVLTPAAFSTGTMAALSTSLTVSADQEKRAALLQSLMEGESASSTRARSRRLRVPLLRFGITALLLMAVLVPLILRDLRIAPEPAAFALDSRQQDAYQVIQSLNTGDLVLVAMEYDAANAPEMDDLALAYFSHLKERGAKPVVISTNSIGISRIQTLLESVFPDGANKDYYITLFIPSGAMGLRDLEAQAAGVFNADNSGAPNGLSILSLEDFNAGIVLSSNQDVTRNYVEQVIARTTVPFVFGTTYAVMPPSQPYVISGQIKGLMAGYPDALVYNALVNGGIVPPIIPILDDTTPEPTSEAPLVATTIATDAPTAAPTEESTAEVTSAVVVPVETSATSSTQSAATTVPTQRATSTTRPTTQASATTLSVTNTTVPTVATTSTPRPTNTVAPTSTPRPTNTVVPTATRTTEPVVQVGTIIAEGAINVRAEASSNAQVITTLQNGDRVRVLNFNDDRTWVSVVLSDNRIGWVAEFLIEIEEVPESQAGFPKIPAFFKKYQQATPDASTILVGTVILDGLLDVLDAPDGSGALIAQVASGDELRVLLIDGEWASIVLPENRIGYIETFTLDIVERPTSALDDVAAPGLVLIEPTATITPSPTLTPSITFTPSPSSTFTPSPTLNLTELAAATNTPRPSNTPRPTNAPSNTPRPTQLAIVTPEATEEATPEVTAEPQIVTPNDANVGTTDGGARWQSQMAGLGMALVLIVGGNLFYLIRGLLRRGRRST